MFNFFKRKLVEKEKAKFVFTSRNIARSTGNGDFIQPVGGSITGNTYSTIDSSVALWTNSDPVQKEKPEDKRQEVNPVEVFDQIKRETPEISFENLDQKIISVKERIDILKQHLDESHLMDEHRALFYLENRKKYISTRQKNPIDWAMTTQEAVSDLCSRYKLKVVPLKQYYTTVPRDGIKEIERYTKAYKAITGDNPIFELVIKDAEALAPKEKKEVKKKDRDPILLANSPLGNHLFILGAWDEEVAIVDEIIYDLK